MSIYQFLIAVRQRDGEMLQNEAGETTSHLMGFFYRTIRMAENGIKPCYVFDGKPPELKSGVVRDVFFFFWPHGLRAIADSEYVFMYSSGWNTIACKAVRTP